MKSFYNEIHFHHHKNEKRYSYFYPIELFNFHLYKNIGFDGLYYYQSTKGDTFDEILKLIKYLDLSRFSIYKIIEDDDKPNDMGVLKIRDLENALNIFKEEYNIRKEDDRLVFMKK